MKKIIATALVMFWSAFVWAQHKVICVPEDFSTIQTAIDSATAGDTTLVGPGIYVENINFHEKNLVVKSSEGPEITIIHGIQKGSVVAFASSEDSTARLEGFTLRNGSGTVGKTGALGIRTY